MSFDLPFLLFLGTGNGTFWFRRRGRFLRKDDSDVILTLSNRLEEQANLICAQKERQERRVVERVASLDSFRLSSLLPWIGKISMVDRKLKSD